MQESQMLLVESVGEVRADKNGIPFKQLFLATPDKKRVKDVTSGVVAIVRAKVKRSSIVVFGKSYLELVDLRKKLGKEINKLTKEEIKSVNPEFGFDVAPGEMLEGAIVTKKVQSYPIVDTETGEERWVDYYSVPVLGNTEDKEAFDQEVARTFKRNQHPIEAEKLAMTPIKQDALEAAEANF